MNDLLHTLPLLSRRLLDLGWEVHAWVAPAGAEALRRADATLKNIHVAPAGSPWRRGKWELFDFPRIVHRTRPGVVMQFSNLIFRNLPVPQVTVLRSLTFFSPEYAAQPRRGVYQKLRYRIGCSLSRKTIERAAAVFCISQTMKEQIVRAYGPLGDKVRVSHLGVVPPPRVVESTHPGWMTRIAIRCRRRAWWRGCCSRVPGKSNCTSP